MPEVHAYPSIPTRILLPIDFSPSSQAALEMAADLALHFHAELYLVNVIPFFPTTTLPDLIPETEYSGGENLRRAPSGEMQGRSFGQGSQVKFKRRGWQ